MASPKAEEEGVLREWAPLSKFIRQIPLRTRQGIFLESIHFSCVSADVDCIAIGTTSGYIFLYNRATHEVHQLRPEKSLSPITCIAVVSSVEYMVAAGDKLGVVSIFRVPKDLPDWVAKPKEKEKIERYTIDELHSSGITALTWSTNGQKLFSGDFSGVVVFTEVDHRMSITRACEVVNEKFKIVQLSFSQHHQALIVATDLRSIICRYNKPNWSVHQVGQRERHCLQELGACFVTDENLVTFAYCCRAGLRLWKANLDGTVDHTVKFKDIIESAHKPVKLLHPLKLMRSAATPMEFGKIYHWSHGLMVSHWRNTVVVFDPSTIRVVATIKDCDARITAVATTQKEIFVIMGQRELVRLSYFPDVFESSLGGVGNMASGEPVFGMPNFSFTPVIGIPLINLPTSNNARVKITAKTANSEPSTNEVSYGMDSIALLPSEVALTEGVPELRLDSSRQRQFSSIGEEDFEEIIFTKHKRKKGRKPKTIVYDNNRNSGEFMSDESGSSMGGSMIEVNGDEEQSASIQETVINGICTPLLPDERPIDKIIEEFKMNEELLESTVVFPPPLVDQSPGSDSNETVVDLMDVVEEERLAPCSNRVCENPLRMADENSDVESSKPLVLNELYLADTRPENINLPEMEFHNFISEAVPSLEAEPSSLACGKCDLEHFDLIETEEVEHSCAASSVVPEISMEKDEGCPSFPIIFQNLFNGWLEMSCPDQPSCISAYSEGLVMCSPTFKVFSCEGSTWMKLPFEASQIFLSPDGQFAARLHYFSAYYSSNWRSKDQWKLLSRNVDSVCMQNDKLWFVSQGELFFMLYCSELVDKVECPLKLTKIYSGCGSLYGLNTDLKLFASKGKEWLPVQSYNDKIRQFCSGPNNLSWLMDANGKIFVSDEIERKTHNRWEVIVADFKSHDELVLSANDKGLYVANCKGKVIVVNTTSISAVNWNLSDIKVDCVQLSAEAVFEDKGSVWVLCKGNRLIGIPSTLDSIHHVNVPCKVVCFACRPQALWLLSEDSEVYMKQGITDGNPLGSDWKKMSSEQLREMQIQITHLSCGSDVVWACDIRGKILMLVGSPHDISNHSYTPAWVLVDGCPLQNHTFTKVFVGPQCHMVWALDNAGNVYVREAVYPELLVGTSWVHVPGLKASHLCISSETVWALNHGGIYKRTGISERNFIGDIWACVGTAVDYLSASIDEKLLSVQGGWIQTYSEMIFPFSDEVMVEKDWTLL